MSKCCGCTELASSDDYDLSLHVVSVVILFAVSAAGALLPVLMKKSAYLSAAAPPLAMEWFMTFGFGVVIGTGFIHMMNDGIEMLSNPCLGDVVESYGSLGMVIVLATVVLMHFVECESAVFFTADGTHQRLHPHGHAHVAVSVSDTARSEPTLDADPYNDKLSTSDAQPGAGAAISHSSGIQRKLAVVIFELGVVFHSVIIGVDLGVTTDTEFHTLLAAMCFHQFFEGIAIGGSALDTLESIRSVLGVALAFALTTPLGLVLGIVARASYSSTSTSAIWVQGVLNCVAGGILVYTGLVELLTYRMTTNGAFLARTARERFLLYAACWLGAGMMALIGKWA